MFLLFCGGTEKELSEERDRNRISHFFHSDGRNDSE